MFDEKSLRTLEYDKIMLSLAAFAQSEGGKQKAAAAVPCGTFDGAVRLLDETDEADRTLFVHSVNPSFAVDDVEEILVKASKGAVLGISEILRVGRVLRVSRRLKKAVSSVPDVPILAEMASRLYVEEDLEKRIFDAFISDTEVADNASQELKSIRQRIRKINDGVKSKLQNFITSPTYQKYLQDSIITMRSDRYVIPIKSDCKGAVAGLIHDQSASGSTLYVEPMVIVELNNDLKAAKIEEAYEIERILRGFSLSVKAHDDTLKWTYETIVDMDYIFARANLARAWKAVRPDLNTKGELLIRAGRHPLIDPIKVVPISFEMRRDDKMLLITGPNTGGKTVTLKLTGLFVLLALSGVYLPAKQANIPVVDGVYSDIGDEQSIEQSLSTFSAHIKNTIEILNKATPDSLLLFDELGAGTDPSEGAALAVSISQYVMRTGAKSLVTSHFNDLKEFALVTDGVAAASMEFDIDTLSPTFKLVMGAIGCSNALDVASKLGLDKGIIDAARGKLSPEKKQFDKVLNAAEETRRKAQQLVTDASVDRDKAAQTLADAEKEKSVIAMKREKLDDTIRRGTKELIARSVEEADEIIAELREILDKPEEEIVEADLFEARKLKRTLENLSAEYDRESVVDDTPLEGAPVVGDNVFVKSLSKKGKLVKLGARGEGEVAFGKLIVRVKKGDFYKVK